MLKLTIPTGGPDTTVIRVNIQDIERGGAWYESIKRYRRNIQRIVTVHVGVNDDDGFIKRDKNPAS